MLVQGNTRLGEAEGAGPCSTVGAPRASPAEMTASGSRLLKREKPADLRSAQSGNFSTDAMRILILHMRYRPDATGTGPIVTELAEDWCGAGEDVLVVTSVPHYGREEIPSEYRATLVNKRVESGVKVYRTLSPVPHVGSALGRGADYVVYTALAGLSGVVLGSIDVVLCVAPPITIGLSGWLIGLARNCPVVFNAQDIWPDGLIRMGRIRNRPLIGLFRWIERFVYGISSKITVVSSGMRANMLAKGVAPDRVEVIPNWVDTERIRPLDASGRFRKEHGLTDKFVALFTGNIGYASGLDSVLDAAGMLKNDPRFVFVIVGEGSAKRDLVRRADAAGLANVRFLTTQPVATFPDMLASCDLGLVPLRRDMGALSVPSKTLAFMAGGRPILASVPDDSEVRRMIEEGQCGVAVAPEDPQALANRIQSLSEQRELLKRYGQNARTYVVDNYSRAVQTRRYRALLRDVAVARSSRAIG
jgi:colanic acid biosynthesis glycosyl transferase WcaI